MPALRVDDLKGKRIGGLVSGGLDSCTVTHWLRSRGAEPHVYTVDLGQPDEPDLEAVRQRMLACGAVSATVLPGQEALAEAGLKVIQARAQYEGGYWNTTAIARYVTTRLAVDALQRDGIDVLFHGATGRGNDQVRFQLATNMLAPQMAVYAPWRDPAMLDTFGGRKEMVEYAAAYGLPIKASVEKIYSTDANMLGLTHEAGQLEELETPATLVSPEMGVWPWDAPDDHAFISLTWNGGRPVAVDGVATSLVETFRQANALAGAHGVGIGRHVVENRFVGIKSRGVYEAPGMELLGQAYEYLLQLYLDRRRARSVRRPLALPGDADLPGLLVRPGDDRRPGGGGAHGGGRVGDGDLAPVPGQRPLRGGQRPGGDGVAVRRGRRLDGAGGVVRPRGRRRLPARPGCAGAQLRQRPPAPPAAGRIGPVLAARTGALARGRTRGARSGCARRPYRTPRRGSVRCASTEGCGRGE